METYIFARKINRTEAEGIINTKTQMVLCLCNEANSKTILQALKISSNHVSGSLPPDVVEILIRAKAFVPLYMPTKAHSEHNMLGLDIIKILERYKVDWKGK